MKVLVTGVVSGLNDDEYIEKVLQLGRQKGTDIKYFNLIDGLEETHDKTLPKILGTTDYIFELLREREYRKIGYRLQAENIKNAVIRVPATILWDRVNFKLKDQKEIKNYIKPDVVVTLIDAEWLIKKRMFQDRNSENDFKSSIAAQNLSIYEILSWMNEEVSIAEDWADYLGVKHYVFPTGQGAESLFKLLKHPDIPSFYVSYSMTHADREGREEVNDVISRLNRYGLVIDPQAIEIGTGDHTDDELKVIYAYTVHRDLHWFVGKVDAVVAIHPYAERPPLSTGMMDELGHARDYHKHRYMIFPNIKQSPFTTNSYIEKGHIFQNAHEFFITLESEGFTPLDQE